MKEFKEKEKGINAKTFYDELKSTWPVISHAIALTASELSIDSSKTLITSIEAHQITNNPQKNEKMKRKKKTEIPIER